MPEPNAAEVLEQDGPETDNAEVVANAGPEGGEGDPQANANPTDDEQQRRKGGWLRKLSKAEQERDFWREEALRNRGKEPEKQQEPPKEDKPPVKPTRPKLADFPTLEDYEKAQDKYDEDRDKYEDAKAEYRERQSDARRQQQSKTQEVADSWATQVAEAETRYPDFKEVAFNKDIPFSNVMLEAVVTSDVGTDIAYELGKNPDLAEKIFKMNPVAATREIGKIEARIEARNAAAEKEEKEEPAATTRAPRPVSPVRRQSASNSEPTDEDDYKTWERKRNAQIKARNG